MGGQNKDSMTALVLDSATVGRLVARVGFHAVMDDLIARLRSTLSGYLDTEWQLPVRSGFHYEKPYPGLVEWMPVMCRGERVLMKVVGYHPLNPSRHGVPTIQCTLGMVQTYTGCLEAVMDGELLTALRTGAAAAVATACLAAEHSEVLGLIGAGAQAVTQAHAISRVRPIKTLLVHDIDPAAAASLEDRLPPDLKRQLKVRVVSASEVVRRSDVLSVATSVKPGAGPVFHDSDAIPSHLHINAIGSDFPGKVEVPKSLLERAEVYPDFHAQAIHEGECQQLDPGGIACELHQLCREPELAAKGRSGLTVFDSTGYALEDFVVAEMAMEWATAWGEGERIRMARTGGDPRSPYELALGAGLAERPSPAIEGVAAVPTPIT